MKRKSRCLILLLCLACVAFCEGKDREPAKTDLSAYTDPSFWKDEALNDIIPFWDKSIDLEGGGFFTDINFDGSVGPARIKYVRMVSRMVYAYSAAYLLGGNDEYLERARHGLEFLERKGWDTKYGGWCETVSPGGAPSSGSKNLFDETYGCLGPALFFFTTGDPKSFKLVGETHSLMKRRAWDNEQGGYYASVGRDWNVIARDKSFNSQMDTCTAYLIYYYLATRDPALLEDIRALADIACDHMINPETGQVGESFSRNWKSLDSTLWVGHNLKTGWVLMRAYWLTGEKKYADAAQRIAEAQEKTGWDDKYGGWFFQFREGQTVPSDTSKDWWTQTEGNFLMLNLQRLNVNSGYLDKFRRCASFWDTYLIDHQYGDCWQNRARNGSGSPQGKGYRYKAAYHTMEHALFNYLYLSLYLHKADARLYFRFSSDSEGGRRYVVPVEYPGVRIKRVEINGAEWKSFDPVGGSITLPAGKDLRCAVTYTLADD